MDTIPKKYSGQLWLLRGLLHSILGNQAQSKKDLSWAQKADPETHSRFFDQKQSVTLTIFPQQHRLCNYFTPVKITLPGYAPSVYLKPSFSFPFIKPPNMIPSVDDNVLQTFTAKSITPKPEAPWIKRTNFGIRFTDEI